MARAKRSVKGGATSARRWIGWRTDGPVFPVEVIIFKRRDPAQRLDSKLAEADDLGSADAEGAAPCTH
jgi:hypothetical protein